MPEHPIHSDQPIGMPSEDRLGVDPFARALATSIRRLASPHGTVLGLNGQWGSGKSSAVNLLRHHLRDAVQADELVVIDFACWWFRGEDALALAFFRELYAGMGPSLGDRFKRTLPKLGARLLRAGALVGKVAEAAGAVVSGGITEKGMEWLAGMVEQGDSVEKLHAELSKALTEQKKRFLVVIDDIDRLSPDEALLIFRLVKSVGRLPNVMYLLVYDRSLAERIVSDRYPSEGPHYLEKIVQAGFELPPPSPHDIHELLLAQLTTICGLPADDTAMLRFMNIFHESIVPSVRTPRDLTRFANLLSVSWPAIGHEVDRADFISLELLRLLYPAVHRAIQQSQGMLTRNGFSGGAAREAAVQRANEVFLSSLPVSERDRVQRMLIRLFPALESVWNNSGYGDGFAERWARERRVCAPDHFESYFRLSVGDGVLPRQQVEEFLQRAGEPLHVKETFQRAVAQRRRGGGTQAAVWLTELTAHVSEIGQQQIEPLLTALFEVLDSIDVPEDGAAAFSIGSNELRLHWLMRALLMERTTLEERSAILMRACQTASLGWLNDITRSAWGAYHPREGKERAAANECLMTEEDANRLRGLLHARLEEAAADGTLVGHASLPFLLHAWADVAGDDGAAVKAWTLAAMSRDADLHKLARAFTSHGWSQGIGSTGGGGDVVARRTTHVQLNTLKRLVDLPLLRERLEALQALDPQIDTATFLEAWRSEESGARV